jgi:hypothetical protein
MIALRSFIEFFSDLAGGIIESMSLTAKAILYRRERR